MYSMNVFPHTYIQATPRSVSPTHHVNLVLVHENPHTDEEGEEQFVLLKQRATDIAVQTEGEVLVDVDNALLKVLCGRGVEGSGGKGNGGENRKERRRQYRGHTKGHCLIPLTALHKGTSLAQESA